MTRQTLITLASAALATVRSARAEILSCADVECPIPNPNVTSATCTVADKTFNAVGILNLDTGVDSLKGLSWVKAVAAEDTGERERIYDQTFYLGTPEDFDFDDTGACALFFTEVSDRVTFGDGDVRNTQGTCGQALSDSCVSALTDRAKKVDLKGLSRRAACEKMQKDFSDNLDSACSAVAQGDRWTGIKAKALSGNASSERISGRQNSTSNCWPVLPKNNDLTLIESVNKTGDHNASTLIKNFFSITPILTVFFPGEGDESLVSEPVAHLTCLKIIDLTTASNETKSPHGGDEEGAGSHLAGNGALAICAVLVSTLFGLLG
ncbi:hypothetical protein C7999DRAFT_35329 [Corynascus novoguineensis]|uniref:Uncharacterized protein n=1 Tax=Corynascus novoguineensis TaxID=1126955 RepID=A0AAN7CP70_9PEZI|nr:hypothetical protein C7999DRAFT_35329 [Corynascus novoguineensis]